MNPHDAAHGVDAEGRALNKRQLHEQLVEQAVVRIQQQNPA